MSSLRSPLLIDVADAMRIIGDGGELHFDARPLGGLRLEADAYGKFRIQVKCSKDFPVLSVR